MFRTFVYITQVHVMLMLKPMYSFGKWWKLKFLLLDLFIELYEF